jgi:AraC-like DNA-binding protein
MGGLRHFVHRPGGALRRYVREILWVRADRPRRQVLLPETTLTLVLRQSGSASLNNQCLPSAVVSGLQQRARMVEHGAGSSLVIVRFTEVGASAILHDRVDLLYDRTLALEAILPRQEIERMQNMLADTREVPQQVLQVEHFLASHIHSWKSISPQLEAAVQMIRDSHGKSSIAALARRAAMSQSTLERHFRIAVGATPKNLSRLARLQNVCRLWDAGKNLTEIAYEAGYSDQPHLVRDFRQFAGRPPREFFLNAAPRNLPTFYK